MSHKVRRALKLRNRRRVPLAGEGVRLRSVEAHREKVARYSHAQLSAVKVAGDINARVADDLSLDELLERIMGELSKLGPIPDMEVVREPEGSRTGGSVTLAN